jgi:hypothetical protein
MREAEHQYVWLIRYLTDRDRLGEPTAAGVSFAYN